MILANVGLSIFNNWAGSRQNKQIAEKREEFERAAREGQRERMLQLMREGQQLTLELEEQKHKERLSELNDQFDNLIKELTYSAAIEHWPLKTLPIVMKNQALGNLLANQEEKVALHCILTSSNCREFNDYVLSKVESALEAYCNVHWSTLTGSPVLFYSGAWKSNDVPTGTQVDSMRAALSNLPTLLITPFFRPQDHKLVFQAHVWGVGYNNSDRFLISEIDPSVEPKSERMEHSGTKRLRFQRDYTDKLTWLKEKGLIEEAVEDIVPYLQCLIGYIADTYFWSAFGSVPKLPRMLTDGTINTDGMKYLVDETKKYYEKLLKEGIHDIDKHFFTEEYLLNIYEGMNDLCDTQGKKDLLNNIAIEYCKSKLVEPEIKTISIDKNVAQRLILLGGRNFLERYLTYLDREDKFFNEILSALSKDMSDNSNAHVYKHSCYNLMNVIEEAVNIAKRDNLNPDYLIVYILSEYCAVTYKFLKENHVIQSPFVIHISKHFYMPSTHLSRFNKLKIDYKDINNYLLKLKQFMTEKELDQLLSGKGDVNNSLVNRVIDAFQNVIDKIKEDVRKEQSEMDRHYEVPTIEKEMIEYEDVISWIRNNVKLNPAFDGAFLTIEKAGLFDKCKYKMYTCFTITQKPQISSNNPKMIFLFNKIDPTLSDMFGKRTSLQINLNK